MWKIRGLTVHRVTFFPDLGGAPAHSLPVYKAQSRATEYLSSLHQGISPKIDPDKELQVNGF
jgi:hypothetical protein